MAKPRTQMPAAGTHRKIILLLVLYFVQGLPFGFQSKTLPVYLRLQGLSLRKIGFAQALSAPWLLKFLWAPLVDKYGRNSRFGRRKVWIVAMQLALAAVCLLASAIVHISSLVMCIFLMNLLTATMDIATDGLALDILKDQELGAGNIAQTVGYKIGMLFGGGFLIMIIDHFGLQWNSSFAVMASCIVVSLLNTLAFDEKAETQHLVQKDSSTDQAQVFEVLQALWKALTSGKNRMAIGLIVCYKLGESLSDVMFKPFLVDKGFDGASIGLWSGFYGMGFSIAGSIFGGALGGRMSAFMSLFVASILECLPQFGRYAISCSVNPTRTSVASLICFEAFTGGLLTTVMFTFMMNQVKDKSIGASHYTMLASLEVAGKSLPSLFSGILAEQMGLQNLFLIGALLSLGYTVSVLYVIYAKQSQANQGQEERANKGK